MVFWSVITAVFTWWFSTGLILWAVRVAEKKGEAARQALVFGTVPVLALGVAGVVMSLGENSTLGVICGFMAALAIWGWIELAFLAGVLTGPIRRPCPENPDPLERFALAWGTVAHHEVTLLLALGALLIGSIGAETTTAVWTYGVLYVARITAKLNLFFGVPQINTEFVPEPLDHMKTYFRKGPVTPAFPAAIAGLSGLTAVLVMAALRAEGANLIHFTLLASLAALALLEHWLMVLPLPDAQLWRWMLPAPKSQDPRGRPDGL